MHGSPLRRVAGIAARAYRRSRRFAVTRRVTDALTRRWRSTPRVIRHGAGAGLRFNPHGGAVGFALGTAEAEEQEALAGLLRPGDVFFDVGANKGFYAVIGAHLVGPQGQVHAFEPFPDSVGAIQDNVALNGFDNVTVWPCAVSDRPGRGDLVLDGDDFEFRLATSLNAAGTPDSASLAVEVVALDGLVAAGRLPPPDVVMIDVEGAEVSVLRGMAGVLREHRPAVLCEVHWIKTEMDEVLAEVVEPLGYRVTQLDGSPRPAEPTRHHLLMVADRPGAPELHGRGGLPPGVAT